MSKDNIIQLVQPGNVDDQLTEILRNGARALLAQAVEAGVADFLGKHADFKTEDGHRRVVRHCPAVSNAATKAIREEIRNWQLRCRVDRWI